MQRHDMFNKCEKKKRIFFHLWTMMKIQRKTQKFDLN
jgi:hypothetical protein